MKKPLSILVLLSMLLALFVSVASAEETLTNLYDAKKATVGTPNASSATGANGSSQNYYTSNLIEVKEGDKIYFGPVVDVQGYYLTSYGENGRVKQAQIKLADVKTHAKTSKANLLICEWTVPAGVASIKMATSQNFFDSTLITKNQPFDEAAYIKHMESKGINVDYMKLEGTSEKLDNKFPKANTTFAGRVDKDGSEIAAAQYRTSDYIPVEPGDAFYFAAAAADQGYHLVIFDKNKKGLSTVNSNYMIHYEDIGRGYMTYMYRIRSDAHFVKVVAATGVYDDGITLATVNQPFTGEQYRKFFNIPGESSPTRPESTLNGKTALFMGDSISYGAGDSASYMREGRAWAGRIAAITGLKATNASVSGAKASYIGGDDTTKWLFNQYVPHKDTKFDIIVMHGGVNDSRHKREIGEISEETEINKLRGKSTTYIGGLQYLFETVKQRNPDADLFFIANHRLDGHDTGYAKDMSPYFDKAKELCEKYGIHFIDLYNNKELNDKLETTTTKYLPDTLHLNAAGYDIITPYIITELEKVVKPTETEAPTTDAPTAEPTVTEAPAKENSSEKEAKDSGCKAVILNGGALVLLSLMGIALVKKKD